MTSKEDFLNKMNVTIKEQQEKLRQLKEKAKNKYDETLAYIRKAINDLEGKIGQAKQKAREIAGLADDKWKKFRASFEGGWNEAKEKFEESWDHLTGSVKKRFS